jgi:ubiquinone/menaquinone biosynthesis C-methylase UbiE
MRCDVDVEAFYDQAAETEWRRLERHRTEYAVTFRALEDHLPGPPCAILDVCGGPGRYAIELARRGYDVTLLELSRECLNLAREKAEEAEVALDGFVHASALDLGKLPAARFDGVLLLGPLYHLLAHAARVRAVREATRVLKPGGRLFAAFITRFAPFRYVANGEPDWLAENQDYARQLLETGIHDRPPATFTRAYYAHPREIAPLMEGQGLRTLGLVGCEGVVAGHEGKVNALEGEAWQAWVAWNYELGQDPSLHGAADHLLYIGEKGGRKL